MRGDQALDPYSVPSIIELTAQILLCPSHHPWPDDQSYDKVNQRVRHDSRHEALCHQYRNGQHEPNQGGPQDSNQTLVRVEDSERY